jgi:hypothetical protein
MGFRGKQLCADGVSALRILTKQIAFQALVSLFALTVPSLARAGERLLLWEIGKADGDNREFALSPGQFEKFSEDGVFFVGESDSTREWPYVHPGPSDAWAGSREHSFVMVFGLNAAPLAGQTKL